MVVTAPPRDGCIPPEMASRSSAPDGSARTCHKSEENISHLCQKRPLAMALGNRGEWRVGNGFLLGSRDDRDVASTTEKGVLRCARQIFSSFRPCRWRARAIQP